MFRLSSFLTIFFYLMTAQADQASFAGLYLGDFFKKGVVSDKPQTTCSTEISKNADDTYTLRFIKDGGWFVNGIDITISDAKIDLRDNSIHSIYGKLKYGNHRYNLNVAFSKENGLPWMSQLSEENISGSRNYNYIGLCEFK